MNDQDKRDNVINKISKRKRMEEFPSDYTMIVPYNDGYALSLNQEGNHLLKTPKGKIITHHNEDFIRHIQSELEAFLNLATENGALVEEQLGQVNSYSLYAGLHDFSSQISQFTLEQVTAELAHDSLLHPSPGPEVTDQQRAWRPFFEWLEKTGIVSHSEQDVFFSGITQIEENECEFYASLRSDKEDENDPSSENTEKDFEHLKLTFAIFSKQIFEFWNNLSSQKKIVVNVLVTLFESPISALCFVNGGCSANQFARAIMPGTLFLDGELDEPIEEQHRNGLKEISSVAHTCMDFLNFVDEAGQIQELIRKGESRTLEFKETLSLDVKKGIKEKHIEISALKTIVGFLNSEGGTLLIGVRDDGVCTGIEAEKEKFHKGISDKLLLHMKNLLKNRIGEEFYPFIQYNIVDCGGKEVIRVDCIQSSVPCYLDNKEFYVRTNPATDKLEGPKLVEYVKNHFGR
jgi:hypothetical protein